MMGVLDPTNGQIHEFKSPAAEALVLRTFRSITCDCGSKEFKVVAAVSMKHNPLDVTKLSIEQTGNKFQCIGCGKFAILENDAEGHPVKWVFVENGAD